MASDEQFSLCWNNVHANIMSSGFRDLLSGGDLVEVTLAAEGRLLQAHKLVLSVCSAYFQEMLKMNPTQHPIVFFKDVSHSALSYQTYCSSDRTSFNNFNNYLYWGAMAAGKAVKYDPNTEAFQMRAQWKKQDNCRQQWFERWSWLLHERKTCELFSFRIKLNYGVSAGKSGFPPPNIKETLAQAEAIRQEASAITRSQATVKAEELKSLKPVPPTSTGVIGWLASRPDCHLEIYSSWLYKPPLRLPDTWDHPDYTGIKK